MKILIADDNKDTLHLLNLILSNNGYAIQLALSKEETLLLVKNYTPYLLLLDAHLGEEDGREICLAIKNNPETSHIKVIIMTGYEFSEQDAVACMADGLLAKPFSIENLLSKIEAIAADQCVH